MVVVTLGAKRACGELDWLYRRHAREVQRYAQRLLRSQADADDVVQMTFVRAFRALDRGERVERPRNWLIKIAHNECRRLLSTRRTFAELPDDLAVEPVSAGRTEEFTRALGVLAPAQRQALVLRELEGRSYAEIAQAMDISDSAVETLLFRARRAVREQLELDVSCDDFPAVLESGDRARVRAHTRVCESCATLERQARGRKSRLSRLASSFFFPKLIAGFVATTATVAIVASPHSAYQAPDVPPLRVDKKVPALVPTPTRATSVTPHHRVSDTRRVSDTSPAATAFRSSDPTIPPGPDPLPVPEPTEPGPPPVPAPPTHSAPDPAPEPSPAPQPAPTPIPTPVLPLPPAATQITQPVTDAVAPVIDTVTTVTNTVEAPVQAVVTTVAPTAPQLPKLPNVSAP